MKSGFVDDSYLSSCSEIVLHSSCFLYTVILLRLSMAAYWVGVKVYSIGQEDRLTLKAQTLGKLYCIPKKHWCLVW